MLLLRGDACHLHALVVPNSRFTESVGDGRGSPPPVALFKTFNSQFKESVGLMSPAAGQAYQLNNNISQIHGLKRALAHAVVEFARRRC